MRGWRRRLATAPAWVYFVYFTVVFGGLTAAMDRVLGERSSWVGWLIGALFFGVLMTAWLACRRRRDGGAEQSLQIGSAIKEVQGQRAAGDAPREWHAASARSGRRNQ